MRSTVYIFLCLVLFIGSNKSAIAQWQPMGGMHHSGKVSFAEIADTLFCSCEYGPGVFRSTDHGATWQDASNGLPEFSGIIDIVARNGVLLCGVPYVGGMFRSTDGGEHWVLANNYFGWPSVFVQNEKYIFCSNSNLLRSSDDGLTWNWFKVGSFISIYSLCLDDKTIYAGTNKGIFTSSDWGEHWDSLPSPLKTSVYSLLMYDGVLFAAYGGMFRSTTGGKQWDTINLIRYLGNRAYFAIADKALFVASSEGILKSTDAGLTWQTSDSLLTDKIVTGIWADHDTIIVGSYCDWLSRSTDGGRTWSRLTGGGAIKDVYPTSLAVKDNSLFVSSDWGIYRSDDEGKTWVPKNNEHYDLFTPSILSRPGFMFCKDNEYFYYSADLGEHWILIGEFGQAIPSIAQGIIYMNWGNSNLASTDFGQTWNSVLGVDTLNMWEIHFYEVNRSIFAAGSGYYGYSKMAYSDDRGKNWTVLHWFDSSNVQITSLTSLGDTLFIGTKDSGIFFSTDVGLNWHRSDEGLGNPHIQVLACNDRILFAGTAKGVFYSSNKGKNWRSMNEGLLDSSVIALVVHNGYLYMGGSNGYFTNSDIPTYNGVYRYPLSKLSVEETTLKDESTIILTASPNPFTTQTIISFNSPKSQSMQFEIFDILGNKIYDGGEKLYSKGENTITLNTAEFPDGFLYGRFTSSSGTSRSIKLFKLQSQR